MEAMRCPECGDVRWSLRGFGGAPVKCELCGAQMVAERRLPGHIPPPQLVERRGEQPAAS